MPTKHFGETLFHTLNPDYRDWPRDIILEPSGIKKAAE